MKQENETWKAIKSGILSAFLPSILMFLCTTGLSMIKEEKVNISISSSTIVDEKYLTTINIKNYQDNKSIPQIKLWLKEVNVADIKTDANYKYDRSNSVIEVTDIMPQYNSSIVICSDNKISEESLNIEVEEKALIVFLESQKESTYSKISEYSVVVVIYYIGFAIMSAINKRMVDKQQKKSDEEVEKLEKKLQTVKEIEQERMKLAKENKHKLQKKLVDYAKELRFWKDTIRNLLYTSKNKQISQDDLFKTVTHSLKTYQTLEKVNYEDFSHIIEDEKIE